MLKRAHVSIYGDVIGVGFRSWTAYKARKLELSGWVKNVEARVEGVFEGEKEKVEKMIDLVSKGPEVAWVEKVDVRREEPKGEFVGFEIRY